MAQCTLINIHILKTSTVICQEGKRNKGRELSERKCKKKKIKLPRSTSSSPSEDRERKDDNRTQNKMKGEDESLEAVKEDCD